MSKLNMIVFDPEEVETLLTALEVFDTIPPVVPDLEVYYKAVEKLQKALDRKD